MWPQFPGKYKVGHISELGRTNVSVVKMYVPLICKFQLHVCLCFLQYVLICTCLIIIFHLGLLSVTVNGTYPNQRLLGFMLVAVPLNARDESTTMGTFQVIQD